MVTRLFYSYLFLKVRRTECKLQKLHGWSDQQHNCLKTDKAVLISWNLTSFWNVNKPSWPMRAQWCSSTWLAAANTWLAAATAITEQMIRHIGKKPTVWREADYHSLTESCLCQLLWPSKIKQKEALIVRTARWNVLDFMEVLTFMG